MLHSGFSRESSIHDSKLVDTEVHKTSMFLVGVSYMAVVLCHFLGVLFGLFLFFISFEK